MRHETIEALATPDSTSSICLLFYEWMNRCTSVLKPDMCIFRPNSSLQRSSYPISYLQMSSYPTTIIQMCYRCRVTPYLPYKCEVTPYHYKCGVMPIYHTDVALRHICSIDVKFCSLFPTDVELPHISQISVCQ